MNAKRYRISYDSLSEDEYGRPTGARVTIQDLSEACAATAWFVVGSERSARAAFRRYTRDQAAAGRRYQAIRSGGVK